MPNPFTKKPSNKKQTPQKQKQPQSAGMINPGMPKPKGVAIAALREAQFNRMKKGY